MTVRLKNIYFGKEFKFCDQLMELREDLLNDFFAIHPNFDNMDEHYIGGEYRDGSWNLTPVKVAIPFNYSDSPIDPNKKPPDELVESVTTTITKFLKEKQSRGLIDNERVAANLPTAAKLVKQFGEHCLMASYSFLKPHSVIPRHTDIENREGKYIRIQLPLVVPKGDVGFEVAGEISDLSDIIAFDNQKLHSAWNNTDDVRLIFIIDLSREICDLPPVTPWGYQKRGDIPDFDKTAKKS